MANFDKLKTTKNFTLKKYFYNLSFALPALSLLQEPILWIQIHIIWIQDCGPIWIRIQEAPEYGSNTDPDPQNAKYIFCQLSL